MVCTLLLHYTTRLHHTTLLHPTVAAQLHYTMAARACPICLRVIHWKEQGNHRFDCSQDTDLQAVQVKLSRGAHPSGLLRKLQRFVGILLLRGGPDSGLCKRGHFCLISIFYCERVGCQVDCQPARCDVSPRLSAAEALNASKLRLWEDRVLHVSTRTENASSRTHAQALQSPSAFSGLRGY